MGYVSAAASDIGVAIRSSLIRRGSGGGAGSEMTLFAGAGIIPGSTASAEWAETGVKVGKPGQQCTEMFERQA